jgi:hypothetical protein
MPRNFLCRSIPERQLSFHPSQRNALRKAIERGFKQLNAVGHANPPLLLSAVRQPSSSRPGTGQVLEFAQNLFRSLLIREEALSPA